MYEKPTLYYHLIIGYIFEYVESKGNGGRGKLGQFVTFCPGQPPKNKNGLDREEE